MWMLSASRRSRWVSLFESIIVHRLVSWRPDGRRRRGLDLPYGRIYILVMRLDDGGLLAALHEGMFEQPLWHGFLEKLRARTGAAYAGLAFRPIDEERIVELHAGPPGPLHPDRLFTVIVSSSCCDHLFFFFLSLCCP